MPSRRPSPDPRARRRTNRFYERIGVDFEFPSLYGKLTARENLALFGSLYTGPVIPPEELLRMVGLEAEVDKKVDEYSKGMKTRLNFVKALAHRPRVLFLDEPTSGLDPVNARLLKDRIRGERDRGATVILTTHNMHDAAELCDRVAFIVDGTVRALDTPHNLIFAHGAARIRYAWLDQQGKEEVTTVEIDRTTSDGQLAALIAGNRLESIHSME